MRPAIGARTSVQSRLSSAVAQRRLGRLELGLRDREVGLALVVLGVGEWLRDATSERAALDLQLGKIDLRLVARHLGLGAFDGDLERPLVDGEQQDRRH